jgi:tetratricopeptide (TPR) repeat protein
MWEVTRAIWILTGIFGASFGDAFAETPANLLDLSRVDSGTIGYMEGGDVQVERLIDGDPKTNAIFSSADGAPVDLLFAFEGGTVAPDSFAITLSNDADARPPARIDLLASTASPSSGFASLRTERIDPLKPSQQARFASAAANWLLVRLYPAEGSDRIALADIRVGGKEGLPETTYAFGESPAEALEIVGAMEGIGAADLSLTPEESEIFALVANGSLSDDDFVTIALLASGVTDPAVRSDYLARVETLTAEAQAALDLSAPLEESGARLLRWLHERALQGGYRERQTNLSVVLDEHVFNCVSSAVLYNAVAGRLGFDVRAIEVPDHAFSIVYDGLDHMDVETTTAEGFNPRRDEVAEFEALTGFRYIPQSNKSKRREVDAAGLAALIYYNHGVAHLEEGRYQEALFANLRAMSLDPDFASAATNALAALGRWSTSLADDGNWEDATEVAAVGVRLAPEDKGLAATRKAIWQKWAFSEVDAGRREAALAVLAAASRETGDESFDSMRAAVLTRPAEDQIAQANWQAALDLTADAGDLLDPEALADLTDWRSSVFRRWAHAEMEDGRFSRALDVLAEGFRSYPEDRRLEHATLYLAQEWARAGGYRDGLDALGTVVAALPEIEGLDGVAEAFVQRHVSMGLDTLDLAAALGRVGEAAALVGPEKTADLGAFVFEVYGHDRIDAEDWSRAAEIYAEGRRTFSDSSILARNARYVAQEWQRQASAKGGIAALEEVQVALKRLFPEFAVDPGFGEDEIVRQINALVRQGEYAEATETLNSAQLLLRPETYRELRVLIFDRQAQVAMKAGDWAAAAAICFDARSQLGEPGLFSNNVAYIAQEWTRAAASESGADGVATAMNELTALFPNDEDVAGMGLRTLRRMVADLVEANEFAGAEQTIRDASSFLSQEQAGSLIITLQSRVAAKAIDDGDWPTALRAYAEGLQIAPDSRDLSRNVPYVFQEWSRQALKDGGVALLISKIDAMQEIFPGSKSLPDVLEAVLGREVVNRIGDGDPQAALDLIGGVEGSMPQDVVANLKVLAYDRWAKGKMDAGEWAEAIRIYDQGLLEVPESGLLDNNRSYAERKL